MGVLISSDLKWCSHISRVVNIASAFVYCILQTFSTKNVWTLVKAYTTYVRPKLEYHNTSVWSPYLKKIFLLLNQSKRNLLGLFAINVAYLSILT